MLKLAADENLDNRILHGLLLRVPNLEIKRAQDAGLAGMDDPKVLEWAAQEDRILVTHDKRTMTVYAYERVGAGQPMPGVFAIRRRSRIGQVIDDLVTILEASESKDWKDLVEYIPL
jgi:Domain of unknown function (DUF5615)